MSRSIQHPDDDPSLVSVASISSSRKKESKLKYKVEKLSDEKSKLQQELDVKNTEIENLNDRISKLTNSINNLTLDCSAVSTAKVADLSKQNRRLNAELISIKSKCRNLEQSHQELEKLLKEKEENFNSRMSDVCSLAPPPPPSELQQLNEKLEKANRKIFDVLNQNAQLKNELKVAQKCLQQEIGENINLSQLMSGNSNWRGRAQQISMLNNKINELREKLDTTSFLSCDDESRIPLKRLESVRRLEVDSLHKDLEECKAQLDEVKQKVNALKARNKNLADEANSYKLKTLDLLEKSNRDEEFIKCLNEQLAMVKYESNHKVQEMMKEVEQAENFKKDSEFEIQSLKCQVENLHTQLDDKNVEIGNLKLSIDQLEGNLRNMSGDYLFSCRQMCKEEYIKLLKSLEEEKNNLLGFMQDLNERLDKETQKVSEQNEIINKQKSKISRLEGKIREIEGEKEAVRAKHRRTLRINEYSRSFSNSSLGSIQQKPSSQEKIVAAEIDKLKIKLEVATERIAFLEKKIKDQNAERHEDNQKFIEIISKSKEIFKHLYNGKEGEGDGTSTKAEGVASECADTTADSIVPDF